MLLELGFRHLVERSGGSGIFLAPFNWDGIRACRFQLQHLASRLAGGDTLRAQGLALAEILLTNGSSPLYRPAEPAELASAIRRVLASL